MPRARKAKPAPAAPAPEPAPVAELEAAVAPVEEAPAPATLRIRFLRYTYCVGRNWTPGQVATLPRAVAERRIQDAEARLEP